MFMPQEASLKTIYSYYLSTVTVNPEGDVSLSDETNHKGLGTNLRSAASNEWIMRPRAGGSHHAQCHILLYPGSAGLRLPGQLQEDHACGLRFRVIYDDLFVACSNLPYST